VARFAFPANFPAGLDANWPAVSALASAIAYSFLAVGIVVLTLGFVSGYLRSSWMQLILLAALAILSVPRWGSRGDFIQSAALGFVQFAVIWWGAKRLVRLNFLGYFLLAMLLSLSQVIDALTRQPNPYFRTNAVVLMAAVAILLLAPLASWRRAARREALSGKLVVPV
jgi:hypothetical protein